MDQEGIYRVIGEILQDVLDDPSIHPTPEMTAKDHPRWDSFNQINILVAAEIRFGIKFRSTEIDGLRNVGDFAQLIQAKCRIAVEPVAGAK